MTTRKSTLKNIVCGYVVRSEHRIDILNTRSIGKGHLNIFLTERFIGKTVSFWDSVKKFRRSHRMCPTKKLFLKISQYLQENTCAGVSFNKVKRKLQHGCFPVNIAKFLRISFL